MYTLQPEKKSRGCVNVLAVIGGIALFLGGLVFVLVLMPTTSTVNSAAPSRQQVEYKIRFNHGLSNPYMSDCAEFDVTYAMPTGTAQKEVEACKGVSFVEQFRANRGEHLYLSIQNTWPRNSAARFSCIISVNGSIVSEVESVGWPNIASCSTLLP